MRNPAHKSGRSPADLAVLRVWDAARVALMARQVVYLAVKSDASDKTLADATDAMAEAFNGLVFAVRDFEACAPIIDDALPNDAPQTAVHRLLTS